MSSEFSLPRARVVSAHQIQGASHDHPTQADFHLSRAARIEGSLVRWPSTLFGDMEFGGVPMPFERNVEIYGEDESAEYVYKVISGSVRAYKILSDGRRQITAFYLPGDVFGIESGRTPGSAEAIEKSSILVVRRSTVFSSGGTRLRSRAPSVVSHRRGTWTVAEPCIAADQDCQGADRGIPVRHGGAGDRKGRRGTTDVASGYRGLSRADDRDRIAHADPAVGRVDHSAACVPPNRAEQSHSAQ